jgi:hypothetical protein
MSLLSACINIYQIILQLSVFKTLYKSKYSYGLVDEYFGRTTFFSGKWRYLHFY